MEEKYLRKHKKIKMNNFVAYILLAVLSLFFRITLLC